MPKLLKLLRSPSKISASASTNNFQQSSVNSPVPPPKPPRRLSVSRSAGNLLGLVPVPLEKLVEDSSPNDDKNHAVLPIGIGIDDSVTCGYMYRLTYTGLWFKLWVELRFSYLLCFYNQTDTSPMDMTDLKGFKVLKATECDHLENLFHIKLVKPDERSIFLFADTEEGRIEWMSALYRACSARLPLALEGLNLELDIDGGLAKNNLGTFIRNIPDGKVEEEVEEELEEPRTSVGVSTEEEDNNSDGYGGRESSSQSFSFLEDANDASSSPMEFEIGPPDSPTESNDSIIGDCETTPLHLPASAPPVLPSELSESDVIFKYETAKEITEHEALRLSTYLWQRRISTQIKVDTVKKELSTNCSKRATILEEQLHQLQDKMECIDSGRERAEKQIELTLQNLESRKSRELESIRHVSSMCWSDDASSILSEGSSSTTAPSSSSLAAPSSGQQETKIKFINEHAPPSQQQQRPTFSRSVSENQEALLMGHQKTSYASKLSHFLTSKRHKLTSKSSPSPLSPPTGASLSRNKTFSPGDWAQLSSPIPAAPMSAGYSSSPNPNTYSLPRSSAGPFFFPSIRKSESFTSLSQHASKNNNNNGTSHSPPHMPRTSKFPSSPFKLISNVVRHHSLLHHKKSKSTVHLDCSAETPQKSSPISPEVVRRKLDIRGQRPAVYRHSSHESFNNYNNSSSWTRSTPDVSTLTNFPFPALKNNNNTGVLSHAPAPAPPGIVVTSPHGNVVKKLGKHCRHRSNPIRFTKGPERLIKKILRAQIKWRTTEVY